MIQPLTREEVPVFLQAVLEKSKDYYSLFLEAIPTGMRARELMSLHTFASLLIRNGESLAYIKDQLGHSSIKMTVDVYGHLVPGANRQAVNKLPGLTVSTAAAMVGQ